MKDGFDWSALNEHMHQDSIEHYAIHTVLFSNPLDICHMVCWFLSLSLVDLDSKCNDG